ncbi:hypothetical protein DFP73DRAFT_267821 [Morchella snyderi]|nr:hypothetical protein DFP73DRAFT_267821 [Morchella snyderi]
MEIEVFFWPLDLLPKSISNARIMAFGYDADVVNFWKPASQNRIFDHAKALSGALGNIRESTDTMERPIIFIGHSLGGLVIEDCLLNSNTSHEDFIRKILRSTTGIAFLGTPHGGSNQAEMAIIGANFLKLITNPNNDILKSLTSSSEALARIQQDFHRVINGLPDSQKIKITCFYEELPVKGIGEIVPKHSAILPAYSNYPLHANHMDMVKFSDPKDQGYIAVTNEIGRWIREELRRNRPAATSAPGSQSCVASAHKVEQRAAEVTSDRQGYSNSGVDQVKKQLYLSDPAHDKEEIIAYKGKRSDGTCEWILDTPEYNSWYNSPESSLFHLSGSPGKGKTVFTIFLIDHLNSRLQPNNASAETPEAILVYYFCDNKNNTRNTAVCIMRAVLFQMLQRRPELLKYIENDEKYKLIGPEIFASFLDLWRIFGGMLKDRNIPMMYIIIDGLDECDESSRALFLKHIRILFQDPKDVSVKFIITSRNYPLICEVLTRFIKIDLDLKTKRLQNDVFRFIDSEIEHLSEEKPYMDAEEVREALKAKADDTFLWVPLVLKELRTDVTSETIKARLRTLPHGLYGIYQRLLDEIPKAFHQHVKEILIWVTFAKRPLNIKGLAIALSFASDPHQSAHEFEQILKDFIRVCSSLVHEQHGIINLVHQSVKDFMLQEFGRDTPTWYRCPQGEAEKYLTKICFNYIEKTPFKVNPNVPTYMPRLIPNDNPFLSYMRSIFGQPMRNNPWKQLIRYLISKVRSLMTIPRSVIRGWKRYMSIQVCHRYISHANSE